MKHEWVHSFHLNATTFGTLSAFYYYAYVPMQLIVGLLVDRFKMRYILTFAILCCVIGSVMIASTDLYAVAAMGRFLQGVGSAFGFVGALKLAATWLPSSRFGFFSCSCAGLGFMGAAIGEISLSGAVSSIGWRNAIYSFSAFGVMLMLLVWFSLKTKDSDSQNQNQYQQQHHESIPFSELLSQLMQIIKTPYVWLAGIISSLMFLPTSAFAELWGIPYLEKFHNYSPHAASTASAMIFIGWAFGARFYSIENYQTAVLIIPACLIISSIIIFLIKNRTPKNII